MKKMISSLGKFAIEKAKKSKYMQNLFEAPIDLAKFPVFGTFTDSQGVRHDLHKGLRSKMKPGWEAMLKQQKPEYNEKFLTTVTENGRIAAGRLLPLINLCGKKIEDLTLLEIGCHSGSTSYALAGLGAKHITASEFTGYKVESINAADVSESRLQEVDADLKELRTKLATLATHANRVEFCEDNICSTHLKQNSYDLICSWDVLEHLEDYASALKGMASLLKEGGVCIHEYNPFFALNGGHSPCTLDFPWGHARLSAEDFEKYIREFRPAETEMALSFYHKGLNRMTQAMLCKAASDAGLTIETLFPYHKEPQVRMLTGDIMNQCRRNYPELKPSDLTAPKVIVVLRK